MKSKLLLVLLLIVNWANSQSPSYLWAKNAGGNSVNAPSACTTDASGNIVVVGSFNIDSLVFGTTTLINSGADSAAWSHDLFIVKYDSNGNVLWAKSAGGCFRDEYALSCSTDASGNIFVSGTFASTKLSFGSDTLINHSIFGQEDMFVVKYDSNGNELWAKSAGGNLNDRGNCCSVDVNGNVFVTGFFKSDSISFGTTTLINSNTIKSDIFIVKYDNSGNVLWAKCAGGYGDEEGQGCSTDFNGNVIITGFFKSDSIKFGTSNFNNSGIGYNDCFIVKYDSNGNVLWANCAGGISNEIAISCSSDINGNIIEVGTFQSPSVTFGTATLTNGSSPARSNMFIVKYDSNGNVSWAKSAGGNLCFVYGSNCSTDVAGNIILTGIFTGASFEFGTDSLTNAGSINSQDLYVAKYASNGNIIWVKSFGGTSYDVPGGCSIDPYGNIILVGSFDSPTINFGVNTLINRSFTGFNNGFYDMFIVKINDGPTGITEGEKQNSLLIYPNPNNGIFNVASDTYSLSSIEVYDLLGEIVYQSVAELHQTTIDLSEQPNGIYFINVRTEQGMVSKKIIINK